MKRDEMIGFGQTCHVRPHSRLLAIACYCLLLLAIACLLASRKIKTTWRFHIQSHDSHAHFFYRTRRHGISASLFFGVFVPARYLSISGIKATPTAQVLIHIANSVRQWQFQHYRIGYDRGVCPSHSGWDRTEITVLQIFSNDFNA